jgi:hypothetical protein
LLVVDEIGYLPINHTGAVLFFQLMNRLRARIDCPDFQQGLRGMGRSPG